jgi:hypothetical protein
MDDQTILLAFGKDLIENCYDPVLANIESTFFPLDELDPENIKLEIRDYLILYLKTNLCQLLNGIVESGLYIEEGDFCIYAKKDEFNFVNLYDISDNLVAEPILDDGWLDLYSKYHKEGYTFINF